MQVKKKWLWMAATGFVISVAFSVFVPRNLGFALFAHSLTQARTHNN